MIYSFKKSILKLNYINHYQKLARKAITTPITTITITQITTKSGVYTVCNLVKWTEAIERPRFVAYTLYTLQNLKIYGSLISNY